MVKKENQGNTKTTVDNTKYATIDPLLTPQCQCSQPWFYYLQHPSHLRAEYYMITLS